MTNTTYNARNMVATNGADYTTTTDAIIERHQAEIDAFLEANPEAFAAEYEDRMVSYGQDYYYDGGLSVDDDGEVSVACDLEALHDLTTDDMDKIELHGQAYVGELECYREIGTSKQRNRARDLTLIDTREEAIRECRADRAKSLQAHMNRRIDSRGEHVAKNIKEAARKRAARAASKAKQAERKARRAARA